MCVYVCYHIMRSQQDQRRVTKWEVLWWCLVVSEGWEQTDVSDGGEFPHTHTNWSTSNIFNKTDTLENIVHLNITRVELWWTQKSIEAVFKPADCVWEQKAFCSLLLWHYEGSDTEKNCCQWLGCTTIKHGLHVRVPMSQWQFAAVICRYGRHI